MNTTPASITNLTEFTETVQKLADAAQAYYDGDGTLLMSDDEYDTLVELVTEAKTVHPDWDDQGILTEVAAGQSVGGTVTHPTPMLSMSKSKEITDITSFVTNLPAGAEVVLEPKLDGLAIRAEYVDGKLSMVVTRGDGRTGELVPLTSASSISGLPAEIPLKGTVELRGEVFMTEKDFEASNAARMATNKPSFANPRNAVSGALRRDEDKITYAAQYSFACYDASGNVLNLSDDYLIRMKTIQKYGVTTAMMMLNLGTAKSEAKISETPTREADKIVERINELGTRRESLDYGIDGAVVKVTSYKVREQMGVGTRAPKWATAFKFKPQEATGILDRIEVAVGRTGRMSLTGVLREAVDLDGSRVGRASLHTVKFVRDEGLSEGARVLVRKQGDIIPRITGALGEQPKGLTPWVPPANCMNCGKPWNKDEVIWRCESPECSLAQALAYWCGKSALDVDVAGETVCEAIAEHELAKNVADLYTLTVEQLSTLPTGTTTSTGKARTLGKANAKKIVDGLEKSKTQPFNRVITGLGIRMTGRTIGRVLASHFKNMDALRAATVDDLASIDMIGPIKAQSIVDGLVQLAPVIDRLADYGVTMKVEEKDKGNAVDLTGKTYVVSGSVPGYNRTTISERIEELGGKATSSVSKKITALVSSETTTSKAKKAMEIGVPVIDPETFAEMIKG